MAEKEDLTQSQTLLADYKEISLHRKVLEANCRHNASFIGDEDFPTEAKKHQEYDDDLDLETTPDPTCSKGRIIKLIGMYVGFLVMGMVNSMIGATLLELQVQMDVGTEKLPLMFTWSFLGRLGGSFACAAIFDRFHPELQMGFSLVLSLISIAMVPLSTIYIVVSLVIAVQGFSSGYLSTATSAHCFHLCGRKTGPYLQTLHFVFSIGCALSPLLAKPFLTQTMDMSVLNTTMYQMDNITNTTFFPGSNQLQGLLSDENAEEGFIIEQFLEQQSNKTFFDTIAQNDDINLVFGLFHPGTFYPYMIIVACQMIASIYFFVQFIVDKCKIKRSKKNATRGTNVKTNKTMLVLFMIVLFCVVGIETTVAGLLYTFIVQYLDWDITTASNLITLYWGVFSGARLVCIFLATVVQPHIMVYTCFSLTVASLAVMSFLSHINIAMWVSSLCIGIAFSCQVPSVFTFAGKFITMSGRNSGLFMAAIYAGGMLVPALTGILSKSFSMGTFPYIQLGFSLLLNIIFTVVYLIGKKIVISQETSVHKVQDENISVYIDSQILISNPMIVKNLKK